MRKIISILLVSALLLTGCSSGTENNNANQDVESNDVVSNEEPLVVVEDDPKSFSTLDDEALLTYFEDKVYEGSIESLNGDDYFVQNIQAVYLSKEYLEEVEYNSRENVFFGYTLSELDKQFNGKKYVFTLDENNQTNVKEFEKYELFDEETLNRIIKNVAIGGGVILLCATISVVSAGLGAPAVSAVFAVSAKTATEFAISGAAFGGLVGGIAKGIETGDMGEALKAAALEGSEGFKWGAISGAIAGGATEAIGLKGATLNGLSMNEAAQIQKESKYPLSIIKQMKSVKEYEVYKKAGLQAIKLKKGPTILARKIDLEHVSELGGKQVTNLERIKRGYAAIDPATGKALQLHHIGQKADGALAILTEAEHQGNAAILNVAGKESEIDRELFASQRKEIWKKLAELFEKGKIKQC